MYEFTMEHNAAGISAEARDRQVQNALSRRETDHKTKQMVNETIRQANDRMAAVRELKVAGGMLFASMAAGTWIIIRLITKMEEFANYIS